MRAWRPQSSPLRAARRGHSPSFPLLRQDLGADLQKELATWKDAEAVPWRFLVRLCAALRERGAFCGLPPG